MTRLPLFLAAALATTLGLSAAPSLPLHPGESLTYRVSWAVVPGAGEIKIKAAADPAAPEQRLLVTTDTATRGLARWLLRFDARSETRFDFASGRMLSLHETSDQRDKHTDHSVVFDYPAHEAQYTNAAEKNGPTTQTLSMPDGDPTDLIMGLLQTRGWNLKPGEKRDALVLFDRDFYELTIHFARYETVHTSLGTFNTVVLEPRMDKTEPKGMFKRGSKVRVWIAQDEHRLPVKFEVEFNIGTGTATLESYTPPAPRAASEK